MASILGCEANSNPDLHDISMGKIVAMGLHDRDLPKRFEELFVLAGTKCVA